MMTHIFLTHILVKSRRSEMSIMTWENVFTRRYCITFNEIILLRLIRRRIYSDEMLPLQVRTYEHTADVSFSCIF